MAKQALCLHSVRRNVGRGTVCDSCPLQRRAPVHARRRRSAAAGQAEMCDTIHQPCRFFLSGTAKPDAASNLLAYGSALLARLTPGIAGLIFAARMAFCRWATMRCFLASR